MQALRDMLRSPLFAEQVVGLPGYDAQGAGDVLRVDSLFEESGA
jgi:hypothetical protein